MSKVSFYMSKTNGFMWMDGINQGLYRRQYLDILSVLAAVVENLKIAMQIQKRLLLKSIILSLIILLLTERALAQDCVILLHGLGRTEASMSQIESVLKKNDYLVINQTYPSTRKSLTQLANTVLPSRIQTCLAHHPKHIHFVTHSLGGVMVQTYLSDHPSSIVQRIVMLAPPNHGSPLIDKFQHNPLLHFILGPCVDNLSTSHHVTSLKDHYEIGIIAGNSSINPFSHIIFKEENDGKVAVASTKIDGMKDFIVLNLSHTFIMRNKAVDKQILSFLKTGQFIHAIHS